MSAINLHCVLLQGRYALQKLGVPKTDKSAVKKSEVTSACQLALGEPPTQTMYTSIMKEVALSSGPSWELKKSPAFVEG
ncbi:hypothetical protein BC829DRAFT_394284 [Chytridium lagenaria]|nr:hypothetical protein BC829DRAFT_394284 [Chytridium lagenaria]